MGSYPQTSIVSGLAHVSLLRPVLVTRVAYILLEQRKVIFQSTLITHWYPFTLSI